MLTFMNKAIAPIITSLLVAACAVSPQPQYQVGPAPRQERVSAEHTHAEFLTKATVSGYDSPPQVIFSRFPDYPSSWRNANGEGTVLVLFTIEADGKVSNPSVVGSPPPRLAALVLDAIMQWKFKPAMRNGEPTSIRVQQRFTFKVE
jgi:TonB family protein